MNCRTSPNKIFPISFQPFFPGVSDVNVLNFTHDTGGNDKLVAKFWKEVDDFRLRKQNDRRSVDDPAFNHVGNPFPNPQRSSAPARCDARKANQKNAHASGRAFPTPDLARAGLLQTSAAPQPRAFRGQTSPRPRLKPQAIHQALRLSLACSWLKPIRNQTAGQSLAAPACHDDDETVFSVRFNFHNFLATDFHG